MRPRWRSCAGCPDYPCSPVALRAALRLATCWARANATSASTISSTTSNSSRRNFAQGSGRRARIGDRSESLGKRRRKWKSCGDCSPPFPGGKWNGGPNFVVGVMLSVEAFSRLTTRDSIRTIQPMGCFLSPRGRRATARSGQRRVAAHNRPGGTARRARSAAPFAHGGVATAMY